MNKLNYRSKTKIEPSTRDSISTWLDVLTSMLVMPDTQRLQVRDELEDHLRSRVDDLLIVGKPEPEAIQIAVAELGETAELAKLITHAHTKSNPRRKIMNAALITVALAGMSFGGFTFITGTGAPSATPNNSGAMPAVVAHEDAKRNDAKTHVFKYDSHISMYTMLRDISKAFDTTLVMSKDSGRSPMESFLGNSHAFIEGELTFDQAITHFKSEFSPVFFDYMILLDDQELRFMSENEYQRSIIETRVYLAPLWVSKTASGLSSYAQSLENLLGVKYDLENTSIEIIGDSIVVAAPPQIHSEVVRFTNELDAILSKRNDERREELIKEKARSDAENKKRLADRQAERVIAVADQVAERTQAEHERRVLLDQLALENKEQALELHTLREQAIERIQAEFNAVRTNLLNTKASINLVVDETAAVRRAQEEQHEDQLLELKIMLEKLMFEHDEIEERYFYIRSRLLDSQYDGMFNIPTLTDAQQGMID